MTIPTDYSIEDIKNLISGKKKKPKELKKELVLPVDEVPVEEEENKDEEMEQLIEEAKKQEEEAKQEKKLAEEVPSPEPKEEVRQISAYSDNGFFRENLLKSLYSIAYQLSRIADVVEEVQKK